MESKTWTIWMPEKNVSTHFLELLRFLYCNTATPHGFPFPFIAPPSSPSHACAWCASFLKGTKTQTSIDISSKKGMIRLETKKNYPNKTARNPFESKQEHRCSSSWALPTATGPHPRLIDRYSDRRDLTSLYRTDGVFEGKGL